MSLPFQCIAVIQPSTSENAYLLAACGSRLVSTCLKTGEVKTKWQAESATQSASTASSKYEDQKEERPSKKQKTSAFQSGLPNIIKLTTSSNGHHAVVVTDDKAVRVFAVASDGTLEELSLRNMPKRPCAIQVLPDNAHVVIGDKHGDVYELPLLSSESGTHGVSTESTQEQNAKPFKPSATTSTVNTMRNLKALEAQQKQKNLTPKQKQPLAFEHKLLLGHVSMLTDATYATQEVEGKQRGYIITADRDEHIRISRGPPQSHVIEGYCLGHKQFVSKIRTVPGTDLLVSGGGDDWVGIWDWQSFKLKWKCGPFNQHVREVQKEQGLVAGDETEPLAVSGIWVAELGPDSPRHGGSNGASIREKVVIVTWEKIPVLAYCRVDELQHPNTGSEPQWHLEGFDAPILDLTSYQMYMSFDRRDDSQHRVVAFELKIDRTSDSNCIATKKVPSDAILRALNEMSTNEAVADLDAVVYASVVCVSERRVTKRSKTKEIEQ